MQCWKRKYALKSWKLLGETWIVKDLNQILCVRLCYKNKNIPFIINSMMQPMVNFYFLCKAKTEQFLLHISLVHFHCVLFIFREFNVQKKTASLYKQMKYCIQPKLGLALSSNNHKL